RPRRGRRRPEGSLDARSDRPDRRALSMNVALVKLSSIGDVVHALPVAGALHGALPQARLVWIVERREAAVLRGNPALSEIVPVDTRAWRRARTPLAVAETSGALVALRRHLRASRFDVAIDLQGLVKSGVVAAATRAPLRIGFTAAHCRERLSTLFTNQRVTPPPAARHIVDRYLAIVAPPTSLDELLAVLRRASVVVAADTGPLHLAAALGTRCVGLYGPTMVERNGPYGRGHRSLESPDQTMASLAIDPVLRAVVEILDGPGADQAGRGIAR